MIPYTAFAKHLTENKIIATPAELHGHLSGMLVINKSLSAEEWIDNVIEDYCFEVKGDRYNVNQVLSALFEFVDDKLKADNFTFNLLLPEDEVKLSSRLEALGTWCGSFLTGLAFAGLKSDPNMDSEVGEFLLDLEKISKVETNVDETQGEEADFIELTEYVKAGVFLLYDEFAEVPEVSGTIQ
jgi:yecA family protein